MKTLLILSPWFPYPPDNGSRLRIFHLLRELSKRYRVRLVTGVQDDSPPDVPEPLAALCEEVVRVPWLWHDHSKSSGIWETARALFSVVPRSIRETPNPALSEAIATEWALRPDAVLVMELGMDAYLPSPLPSAVPVVMDGAEFSGMERAWRTAAGPRARLRHGLTWLKGTRYWRRRLRSRYAALTAVSPQEADAVRRVLHDRYPPVHVIANGVDMRAYSPRQAGNIVPGRLIFNGSLRYGPNRDAVRWFVEAILPRIVAKAPEAHLWVTGRYENEDAARAASWTRVHLTGFLPDLRSALNDAVVCVVPLRAGGGTRLKILEAWAAGVPVVSTTVGAAGLAGRVGEHLLIADDPVDFAYAVVSLLNDLARGERLASAARNLAEERYDWAAIGGHLTLLLDAIIAGAKPASVA